MHLFLFISGIVLFPKVYMLKCYECTDGGTGKCSDTETECSPESDRCLASRITVYVGNSATQNFNSKGCVPASHCIGSSVNIGTYRNVLINKCCTTDLCNDQLAPEPAAPRPNGKKCISCGEFGKCTLNVDCMDNEDYCFSASAGQNMTIKGCASKEDCLKIGMPKLQNGITAELMCCQGNYCNSAGSAGGSLLLLVATVVSLVLFS